MQRPVSIGLIVLILSLAAGAVIGQDTKGAAPQAGASFGPPEELKQAAYLIGTWDFTARMRMTPTDSNWMSSSGTAKYEYVVGGSALMMTVNQPMMGWTMQSGSFLCYDRQSKLWQLAYVDNMSAHLSTYTGTRTSDGWVYQGTGRRMGEVTMLDRVIILNESPTSYDWKLEMSSDNGATWAVFATAKYTKQK